MRGVAAGMVLVLGSGCGTLMTKSVRVYGPTTRTTEVDDETVRVLSEALVVQDARVVGDVLRARLVRTKTCVKEQVLTIETRRPYTTMRSTVETKSGNKYGLGTIAVSELFYGFFSTGLGASCFQNPRSCDNLEGSKLSGETQGVLFTGMGVAAAIGGIIDVVTWVTDDGTETTERTKTERSKPYVCETSPVEGEAGYIETALGRVPFSTDEAGLFRVRVLSPELEMHAVLDGEVLPVVPQDVVGAPNSYLLRAHVISVRPIQGRLARRLQGLYLATLAKSGLKLVPNDALRRLIDKEMLKGYGLAYDEEHQVDIGFHRAPTVVLQTSLARKGRRCVLSAWAFDLRTATTIRSATKHISCRHVQTGVVELARELTL